MTGAATPTRRATIVGAGPAGLMAAEVLAAAGWAVTLFDRMPSLGRKLLLAGRGGLNLTHSEALDELLARYGAAGPRLEEAIRAWGPAELREWCAGLGEPTFVGSSGRVFPQSFRATPLLRAWLRRLAGLGVQLSPSHRWLGWTDGPGSALRFSDTTGDEVTVDSGDATLFALGGASWPRSGSDGGWVTPFRQAGIAVNELRPSNCGLLVDWTPAYAGRFAGVPLKNVAIRVAGADGPAVRGDAMVTRHGLEGGPIYAWSPAARDAIERVGGAVVSIDLHPDLDLQRVRERLFRRRPKDSLTEVLRRTLGLEPVAVGLLREATGNQVPTDATALGALVKAVPVAVTGVSGIERAISSAGGVALDEVDDHFMLRRAPGTFVAGEMLDWEAPTGGYLLQATFSTAVAAATGILDWRAGRAEGQGEPR